MDFLLTYLSIYPSISFFHGATGQIFGQFKRIMAQTTCFRNHWCLFGVSMIHFNVYGIETQKNIFGAWIGVLKPNTQNIKTSTLSNLLHRFPPNFALSLTTLRMWSDADRLLVKITWRILSGLSWVMSGSGDGRVFNFPRLLSRKRTSVDLDLHRLRLFSEAQAIILSISEAY